MPYFSIILPTYQRDALLRECLHSIIAQKFSDFEVIVVDDANSESTKEMVSGFKDDRLKYALNAGRERSAARNTGLSLAKGEYICFVDDDDLLRSSYLFDFAQYHQSHPQLRSSILRTRFQTQNEIKSSIRSDVPYVEKKHKHPLKYLSQEMCGMTTVCIPLAVAKSQIFNENFYMWEDNHYLLRVMEHAKLVQLPQINYIYRIHKNMSSKAVAKNNLTESLTLQLAAINDYFDNFSSLILDEKDRDKIISEKYLQYANYAIETGMKQRSFDLIKLALKTNISWHHWKAYLNYFRNTIMHLFYSGESEPKPIS